MLGLARAGAPEGQWLRAESQTGGKGRSGRQWASPRGNLYASTLVRLRSGDPAAPSLALVAGIALHETVSAYAPHLSVFLKWPNDLLCNGAKLAGILLEREGDAVIAGFGVNLSQHPGDIDRPATSFTALEVGAADPAVFAVDLAAAFARWLARWRNEGLGQIRAEWLGRAHPVGTPLSVRSGDQPLDGLFEGLDEGGALRLRLADGSVRFIQAGDVFLI